MSMIRNRKGTGHNEAKAGSSSARQNRRRRRGSQLVEFALVLPFLLILTLGLVQYGLIYNTALTITNLSRDSARYAAINSKNTQPTTAPSIAVGSTDPNTKIRDYVKRISGNFGVNYNDLAVTITPDNYTESGRNPGNPIKLTVAYDMKKKLFLPTRFGWYMGKDPDGSPHFAGVTFYSGTYTVTTYMVIE